MRDKEVEGRKRMKGGFEDSNQTCCDINTAQSGNLVGKIRYDYRARAERLLQPKQSATVRSHFKVNQHSEVLDFGEMWSLFSYKEARGRNTFNIKNMFGTWGSVQRHVYKVTEI